MLTIRCDGIEIQQVTIGSRDVLYRDRTFRTPFVVGEKLTEGTSPLYRELVGLVDYEWAAALIARLPADAIEVTIRDEYRY